VLIEEQSKSFIQRVLEIEQELIRYPEKKKELDRELILLSKSFNKLEAINNKKEYRCVQVEEVSDMIQVRFSFSKED
jgi:hypothetical protein